MASDPATCREKGTPLISIVLSFRNEEAVIEELVARLQKVLREQSVKYELLFINDASTDRSLSVLTELRARDPGVKIVTMSRKFGVQECILAGLEFASGDAVITMDADLQDPPELIPELLERWRKGADVVHTVRASRSGESAFKKLLTRLAYRAIRLISEVDLIEEAGDFKLVSRQVLDQLLRMKGEKEPYLRGLIVWTGFRQECVTYHRQPRLRGESHFPIFRSKGPIKTFISGITSFSLFPLQCYLLIAILAFAGNSVCLGIVAAQWAIQIKTAAWWPVLVVSLWVASVLMVGIGLVGLYLGKIYHEVRRRPNYIVESQVGFTDPPRT